MPPPKNRTNRRMLNREDWITAARDALIHGGIEKVKVESLASSLGVSRGSFYWHFKNRQELKDELITSWEAMAAESVQAVEAEEAEDAFDRFSNFMRYWVEKEPYFPVYDASIRNWARMDDNVAMRVRDMDDLRIGVLNDIFLAMGHEKEEAFIRARITYFHQIGYYALDLQESSEQRRQYWPLYVWILSGR